MQCRSVLLYKHVLQRDPGDFICFTPAKRRKHLQTVLTKKEVQQVLNANRELINDWRDCCMEQAKIDGSLRLRVQISILAIGGSCP